MPTLRDFLEKININATIDFEEPMAPHTTFRIGGPAEAFVAPRDSAALARLVHEARREGIPLFFLGGGANILVGDRGIRGIVIDMAHLDRIEEASPAGPIATEQGPAAGGQCLAGSERILVAQAGLSVDRLCEAALERGLSGLENFYGMPGSVGGAVFMNARCYEVEMADRLDGIELLAREGERAGNGHELLEHFPFDRAEWSYKKSPFQAGGSQAGRLIVAAAFRLARGDRAAIEAIMRERRADREAKGHYRLPSAGSVFKNNRAFGKPSGKILDELGFRGRRIGDAMVSEWHANIFVNAGKASAIDMRRLIEEAENEVRARLGLQLEPEVLFVGDFA